MTPLGSNRDVTSSGLDRQARKMDLKIRKLTTVVPRAASGIL